MFSGQKYNHLANGANDDDDTDPILPVTENIDINNSNNNNTDNNDYSNTSFYNGNGHNVDGKVPSTAVHRIETSFNPAKTWAKVRAHKLSAWDLQYVVLVGVGVFSLFVMEEPTWPWRIAALFALVVGLAVPVTSQVVFPLLPIFGWLVLFGSCPYIPTAWRPQISVTVLPTLETVLYGGNLSEMLASRPSAVGDVLAWLPYGVMHYGAPFVVAILLFVFASPGTLPVFARAFGYMNLTGVTIQLMLPNAPPWYEAANGFAPANYSMHGSPGGLARVDDLLGINLYSSAFGASPLVFGALPSLHSGFAVMEALFLTHVFPRLGPLFFTYVGWIWWSTMYLTHHYFIDLMGGAVLAISGFTIAQRNFLPAAQEGKSSRWQYEYIELTDYDNGGLQRQQSFPLQRVPPGGRKLSKVSYDERQGY
ncbi:hypothetical protein V1514DRAFT_334443 [Lipomyces japonicus]|uniref:uncharacterized protein n=1 Tax=Lipomyces japonicus TaxID=56871 RepID=UPI0034D013FD